MVANLLQEDQIMCLTTIIAWRSAVAIAIMFHSQPILTAYLF